MTKISGQDSYLIIGFVGLVKFGKQAGKVSHIAAPGFAEF
jgi:hypothetical protein